MQKYFLLMLFITAMCKVSGSGLDTTKNKRVKIYPFPALGYAPETRWYVGAVALFNMKLSPEPLSPSSTFKTEFNITQNKQLIISAGYDIYFFRNRYRLIGDNGYYKFPEDYWGFGINSKESDKISYDAKRIESDVSLLRRNRKNYFIGIRHRYHNMLITDLKTENYFLGKNSRFIASGLGLRLMSDTRVNVLNPSSGTYFSFSALFFNRLLGNKLLFNRYDADARYYKSLWKENILAFQAVFNTSFGTTPFRMASLMGSDGIMRGYYPGRYRDSHMAALQSEYRFKIWKIFGAAAFGGFGTVFNRTSAKHPLKLKPSYGGGIRIRIDKKDNVNLRFDYAKGDYSDGFYVSFGEAF